MELIQNLGTVKDKKGNYQSIALFKCAYCLQYVIKKLGHGLRDKSCNCVQYKLVSESNKGKIRTEKQRKLYSEIKKGIKHTEDHNKKISIGNKGKSRNKGKKHTEETIKKIKDNHAHLSGKNHPMYGKLGRLSPNWQGGKSFEPYGFEFNAELKQIILERDNYICQNPNCCDNHKKLNIHHIDFNKQNNSLENLITLGISCHIKTNGKNNRQYWINYYQNVIKDRND